MGNRLCKEGFSRSRRPIKQNTFWRSNADLCKEFRPCHRQLNRFPYLGDLPLKPADILVCFTWKVNDFHTIYLGIVTAWQKFHNCQ